MSNKRLYKVTAIEVVEVETFVELTDKEVKALRALTEVHEYHNAVYDHTSDQDCNWERTGSQGFEHLDIDLNAPLAETD